MTSDVKKILIVGAGCIGTQVAALCALRGFETSVLDTVQSQLSLSKDNIAAIFDNIIARKEISQDMAAAANSRLTFFDNMELAATNVDVVIESVPESLDLKKEVFSDLNRYCKRETIFTTNTSDLPPSLIAPALQRPEQFAAFHFHAPLLGADVVDIMPHPGTAPEVIILLRKLANDLEQTIIELNTERPGYLFNNMLNALNRAALELAIDNVAPPETIDKAWTKIMHTPIGPFGILDKVGLDTAHRIAQMGAEHFQDSALWRIVDFLGGYVGRGHLGVKTGQGFYSYNS
ncbi:3-hydroxyacyl-CoA dehydrogenase NAD-binding domain-containing protein [Desulfovibrio inopinatus]|uniref:3-hydroxyacyl-CoA dehydrogenase NAD-binding domain-containing protein n=1 Tax=Desulfovibrio inopinatus TaxID=102109 RepID=UPI0004077D85|nr:3-hydroxyacyl-CoA dehydrogenase NAD-binding domain-containing protein [Desulfovibrio inopinatus]